MKHLNIARKPSASATVTPVAPEEPMASIDARPTRHRPLSLALVLILAWSARSAHGQATQPRVHPVLRLEKPEYLFGEQIRFWTGMDVEGGGIVTENRNPC